MRSRRGVLIAVALLVPALSACATPTPQEPSPSPAASTAAPDACADSPGAALLTPLARMTPRDLCEADGATWQEAPLSDPLEMYPAFLSDDAACDAAYDPWRAIWPLLSERLAALAVLDPEDLVETFLGSASVSVLTVETPALASDTDRILATLLDACVGTTPPVDDGREERIEALDVEGWSGMRIERIDTATSTAEIDVQVLWRLVDERLAIVQVPSETDAETLATALDVQGRLLETPREQEDLPDDCSLSDDGDPSAPPTPIVTPADLCAIDGLPWVHGPYSPSVEYVSPASTDPVCLAVEGSAYQAPFDLTSTAVRLPGADPLDAEIGVGVVIDPVRAAELAADLDAVATCAGTAPVAYDDATQAMERLDEPGWNGVRITQTPGPVAGSPDAIDVEQHWAVVDGTLAFVQIPVAVDDDVAQTVLDAQLSAIGG